MGSLGTLFCEELDIAKQRLQQTLAAADGAGFDPTNTAYLNAKGFLDTEDSFWSGHVITFSGSQCSGLAAEGNKLNDALRAALSQGTGLQIGVYRPDYTDAESDVVPDIPSITALPWWAYAALGLGGLLAVGYAVNAVTPAVRTVRALRPKLSGYRRRRRR